MKYVYIRGEEGLLDYFLSQGATNPYYYKCNSNTDVYYIDENHEIHAFDIKIIDVCKKPITTLKEVKNMNKQSLKSKLKPGMVVKTREGNFYIFLNDKFMRGKGFIPVEDYNDNLICIVPLPESKFDIIEIYESSCDVLVDLFWNEKLKLIWKRTEVVEFTMKEIADKLNIPVEQLRIKD